MSESSYFWWQTLPDMWEMISLELQLKMHQNQRKNGPKGTAPSYWELELEKRKQELDMKICRRGTGRVFAAGMEQTRVAFRPDQRHIQRTGLRFSERTSRTITPLSLASRYPRTTGKTFRTGTKKDTKMPVDGQCAACCESHRHDMVLLPCGHEYCKHCIDQIFRVAISDPTHFPPRCCTQIIPRVTVSRILPAETLSAFEQKQTKLNTPNCTYCHEPSCGAFIPPQKGSSSYTSDVAEYTACGRSTCTTCKASAHVGDCPKDTSLQQLLHAAKENQWQRCYKCRRLVQLAYGCLHITCLCGAHFCYLCGHVWNTCDCDLGGQHRLLD
ncbi:uncharacterized protein K452DRAFT_359264 [Aplosporella prunicola CBS 121167]|uniref:RBR-type E3 ubiquitin transferase n=1 Tax=Aplosporella prunicola CBS 121167 TaxID=1176127 RepID=A0A6A6B9B4_9PEZI|nr:uncharacterized protein K452DRAFT_359264 [Aplosporella prunicola CBS 121167]KAF2140809.1 hypothetical protein K452DRAFT_359264 [Aplosporella prunicola CBS 121167]